MLLSIGWLSGWIFQVTGASGRASGYGAPEMPPVPNWDALPLPLLPLPELTLCWAPPPQAARIAAALGMATPATAARRRKSRRLMRARRSFGCGIGSPLDWPGRARLYTYSQAPADGDCVSCGMRLGCRC